jgi:hypothetical protein
VSHGDDKNRNFMALSGASRDNDARNNEKIFYSMLLVLLSFGRQK